jgi:hypothetical protein
MLPCIRWAGPASQCYQTLEIINLGLGLVLKEDLSPLECIVLYTMMLLQRQGGAVMNEAVHTSSINQNAQPAMLAGQLTLTHYHVTPEPRRE